MRKRTKAVIAVTAILLVVGAWIAFNQEEPEGKVPEVKVKATEITKTKENAVTEDGKEIAERSEQAEDVKVNTEVIKPSKENKVTESKMTKPAVKERPQDTHVHEWDTVYAERQVEKTRQIAWTKCYACGEDMTGNISHIDQHLMNHEENVHYGTEYRTEIYYETEKYISGYKCGCGKTK